MTARRSIPSGILDALGGLPLYITTPLYRHWHLCWGATEQEVRGPMPGDDIVPKASFNATRAITIAALPELVWLQVGDWMPMASKVNETTAFKVKAFEPNRWLLWEKPDSSWASRLAALPTGGMRLITRLKQRYQWESPAMALFTLALLEFGDFLMMRRVLKGVKSRAEGG